MYIKSTLAEMGKFLQILNLRDLQEQKDNCLLLISES